MAEKKDTTGFGAKLRAIRDTRGLSQRELGELCDPVMSYQDVARLERGSHTPSWSTVIRICTALGISPEEFLPNPE